MISKHFCNKQGFLRREICLKVSVDLSGGRSASQEKVKGLYLRRYCSRSQGTGCKTWRVPHISNLVKTDTQPRIGDLERQCADGNLRMVSL